MSDAIKWVRMSWQHDNCTGHGDWWPGEKRFRLQRAVDFGNAHHGADTHWLDGWTGREVIKL